MSTLANVMTTRLVVGAIAVGVEHAAGEDELAALRRTCFAVVLENRQLLARLAKLEAIVSIHRARDAFGDGMDAAAAKRAPAQPVINLTTPVAASPAVHVDVHVPPTTVSIEEVEREMHVRRDDRERVSGSTSKVRRRVRVEQ